ncbi:MAG: hypothetical protein WC683_04010 [bacterium]
MSIIRFAYHNYVDEGTISVYSSQIETLPVSNLQDCSLLKKWKSASGTFKVVGGYNDVVSFRDTATDSIRCFVVASGTYTGSGLAAKVQSGLRGYGRYNGHTFTYNGAGTTDRRFRFIKGSTATVLALLFGTSKDRSLAHLLGMNETDRTASSLYGSFYSHKESRGNQQWLRVDFDDQISGTVMVIDAHNLASGTVMRVRSHSTGSYFNGLNDRYRGEGVFRATTNLVTNPEDWSVSPWSVSNMSSYLSLKYALGKRLTALSAITAGGYIQQAVTFTTATPSISAIMVRGTSATTNIYVRDFTAAAQRGTITINWATKAVSFADGAVNGSSEWLSDDLVIVRAQMVGVVTGNVNRFVLGSLGAVGATVYATAAMAEDTTPPTAYTQTTRASQTGFNHHVEPLPTKFTFKLKMKPLFPFDIASGYKYPFAFSNQPSSLGSFAGSYFLLRYHYNSDRFLLYYFEGETLKSWNVSPLYTDNGSLMVNHTWVFSIDLSPTVAGARVTLWNPGVSVYALGSAAEPLVSQLTNLAFATYTAPNNLDSYIQEFKLWRGYDPVYWATEAEFDAAYASKTPVYDYSYKNTPWMTYLESDDGHGHTDEEIGLKAGRSVHYFSTPIKGKSVQLSWHDPTTDYSEIGRLWIGNHAEQQYHYTGLPMSFKRKARILRSKATMSRAGVSYIDREDPLWEYEVPLDLHDPYLNSGTKTRIETFLEEAQDSRVFYTDFNGESSVYGYIVKGHEFSRIGNSSAFQPSTITIREQK